MADWTVKIVKIEEATRKKDELNNEFIIQTKEALEAKMETVIEKREAIISDKKEKLKVKGLGRRQLKRKIKLNTCLF